MRNILWGFMLEVAEWDDFWFWALLVIGVVGVVVVTAPWVAAVFTRR